MTTETSVARPEQQTERTGSIQFYRPYVNIGERADELVISAEMPGATAENIDVHFEDGQLNIHARVAPRAAEGQRFLLQEYGVGDFYRTFRVGEQVDPTRIAAEYRNGVLTLRLPKVEAAKPRKITVQSA
jgi:HSP20 family protein